MYVPACFTDSLLTTRKDTGVRGRGYLIYLMFLRFVIYDYAGKLNCTHMSSRSYLLSTARYDTIDI